MRMLNMKRGSRNSMLRMRTKRSKKPKVGFQYEIVSIGFERLSLCFLSRWRGGRH